LVCLLQVRWIRALYSNLSEFTADQERLISNHGGRRFDYVEGFVVAAEGLINGLIAQGRHISMELSVVRRR
jgi:hypothetical protein